MEVDGLGARCALSTCGTLDYLPYRCNNCNQQFCSTHAQPATHQCAAPSAAGRDVPACPLCNTPVPRRAGESSDLAVSRHIDAGCPRRVRNNPLCHKTGCSKRDPASTSCATCHQVFCLSHRLEQDHDCTVAAAKTERRARKLLNKNEKQTSSAAESHRHELYGLPQKRLDYLNHQHAPIGDDKIPIEERIPVAVFFPAGSGIRPRFMFFSERSSAGKIIDGLRKNISRIPPPKDGNRYCLYVVKRNGSGVNLLPQITPLKDLQNGILQPDDFLVMENGEGGLNQQWLITLGTTTAPIFGISRRFEKRRGGEKCSIS